MSDTERERLIVEVVQAARAWLVLMHVRFGLLSIVRWGSDNGVVIGPPAATRDGTWQEAGGSLVGEEAMRAKLADIGAMGILDAMTGRRG